MDTTQQDRPFDAIIDDALLKAERYNWNAEKLRRVLLGASIPGELAKSVIDFTYGDN